MPVLWDVADPTDGVKRLKEQKGTPKWLSRREVGALVRAVQKIAWE
ncbi:MAG: hypothetical protein M1609_14950 [Firmicutes bacterium]|nr:hypothetical protein [Bacillota bacterium]MCL5780618.1 hypothetical protein [Bacillota bacterium]